MLQAILQHIRNHAALMDKTGRQPPPNAPDYRAYHAGAADALEEMFWFLMEKTKTS
jgi:hypothetical protein